MQVSKKLVKIQAVIDRLEDTGLYVHLAHINNGDPHDTQYTVFDIDNEESTLNIHGIACCAKGDAYNKVKGTQLAFGRAMQLLSQKLGADKVRALLNWTEHHPR